MFNQHRLAGLGRLQGMLVFAGLNAGHLIIRDDPLALVSQFCRTLIEAIDGATLDIKRFILLGVEPVATLVRAN